MANRYSFYIDGFNVYHVIDEFRPKRKWLDLYKLVTSVVPASVSISDVYYFSALATWMPERASRHKTYIRALKATNIKVVLGRFKTKERQCKKCGIQYVAHEEKQTDVNIALRILEDAIADRFDTAVIVSGDTDFLPVIRTVHRLFPEKRVGVLLPIGSKSDALKNEADFNIKMKVKHLDNNQLPDTISTAQGIVKIPDEYK